MSASTKPDLGTWIALGILTIVMFISYVDRFILAILVQPIKADLHLSDSQIGLLTGFAFSICHAIAGVPIARLADTGSRRLIISASLGVWSVMTALTGQARTFIAMMAARVGVGIGEAGGVPASYSMISDLFPMQQRAWAMAIYSSGAAAGLLLAFAIGGTLEHIVGWRQTFAIVGTGGLAVALLLPFLLREPIRGRFRSPELEQISISGSVWRELWDNRAFRHLTLGLSANVLLTFGRAQWLPAFLGRSFGGTPAHLGPMIATVQSFGMIPGILLGGWLSDRLTKVNALWPMRIVLLGTVSAFPLYVFMYNARTLSTAYALLAVTAFLGFLATGPSVAMIQNVVQPGRRATASAVLTFLNALIGMGGGPFLVGALSDVLMPAYRNESLRWALLIVTLGATPWAIFHYLRAQSYLRKRIVSAAAVSGV